MRINPDKLNKLAHTVADTLAEIDQVGFMEDRNTIRQEARKALQTLLTEEARIDTAARTRASTISNANTTTKSANWAFEATVASLQPLAEVLIFVRVDKWP